MPIDVSRVPEIVAEDLEIVDAEPVTAGVAVARHAGPAVPQTADLFGVVASYAERGIAFPIESLERLIALQERAQERNARDAFFRALATFQEECPPVRKTRTSKPTTGDGRQEAYTWAPLDEIAKHVRPYLAAVGLSYSWSEALEGQTLAVTCHLRHIDGHSETSTFTCPTTTKFGMSDQQKVGSAGQYGRRYSLVNVLGLTTTDEDDDAQDHGSAEAISAAEAQTLRRMMDEAGVRDVAEARFLTLLGVDRVEALSLARFDVAQRMLEEKIQRNRERVG